MGKVQADTSSTLDNTIIMLNYYSPSEEENDSLKDHIDMLVF